MAWWQRRPKADRETIGDKAHSHPTKEDYAALRSQPGYSEFEARLEKARMIQPGSIHLTGMELERAVQKEVCGEFSNPEWELSDMLLLFLQLESRGFTLALSTCRSGWACSVGRGDILEHSDCVREFAEHSPAIALARAAVAAVRQWPE